MKRILIIEDEPLSAKRLKRLLNDIDDTFEITGPLCSIEEVIDKLRTDNDFNLILSDIRLRNNLVFVAFQEVMPLCPVVFTTAYEEYALEAFRNNGIDYLLKPIDAEKLFAAIKKINFTFSADEEKQKINAVSREIKCYRERILITKGDELVSLRTADIRFFRKEGTEVIAYSINGKTYKTTLTLNDLEEQLSPLVFFRLNRQYIVHIDSVKKISLFFNNKLSVRITDCDEDNIVVSKEKSTQFKQWLNR